MSKIAILLATHGNSFKHLSTLVQVCKTVFTQVDLMTYKGQKPSIEKPEEAAFLKDAKFLDYTLVDLVQNDYQGLVVPDGMGFYHISGEEIPLLKNFVYSFVKFKKPVCMVGTGCAVLLATKPELDEPWMFYHYSLTAPSIFDDLSAKHIGTIPSIEEFSHLNFAHYTSSDKGGPHIVIDDHLVTCQHRNGSLLAIQTFILLCNK